MAETVEISPTFEDFWNAYDKKVGKPNALKQWKLLTREEKELTMEHVPAYVLSRDKKYRKDPERYLKHKTFEDEIITDNDTEHTKQSTRNHVIDKYFSTRAD